MSKNINEMTIDDIYEVFDKYLEQKVWNEIFLRGTFHTFGYCIDTSKITPEHFLYLWRQNIIMCHHDDSYPRDAIDYMNKAYIPYVKSGVKDEWNKWVNGDITYDENGNIIEGKCECGCC